GKAACLVDPMHIDEMAQGLSKIIMDSDYRQTLIESGYHQIKQFSWRKAARLTTAFNRYNDFTHRLVFGEMRLRQVLLMADFREVRFVREKWPLRWTPRHLSYRLVRWIWYRSLRVIYFIEMPGETPPSNWQMRIVGVAKP
ncbi:MAG: hypothetical protein V3U86_00135, partial [Acidobacteriota bacterium]